MYVELSRRDESETCRHISGVRTVWRARDGWGYHSVRLQHRACVSARRAATLKVPPSSHPSPLEPPAACGNCAPTSPQSRVESGHALSHTTTCHLSTSWRIRMNISRCVPGRERPRGCIVPTRTPARARRRSGANGASGASSSMSITSAASRHPRGAARPKQVSHGRCPASAAAGLREPQGFK